MQLQYLDNFYDPVIQQTYTVSWVDIENKKYNPIPDMNIPVSGKSILVGVNCPKAYIEWKLAAHATIQAKFSLNSAFGDWIDISRQALIIRRLTYIPIVSPGNEFRLRLEIPHWHEEIYLEVWQQI